MARVLKKDREALINYFLKIFPRILQISRCLIEFFQLKIQEKLFSQKSPKVTILGVSFVKISLNTSF